MKKDGEKASVGHGNLKSQLSQFRFDAATNHSLQRFYERLVVDANKDVLKSNIIQTLYDEHAGDFTE